MDGIWEPVRNRQSRILGIIPVGEKAYENNGCFNYFVKDTIAPMMSRYNESVDRTEYVRTHWRLLWEDTRYKDGVVPDEFTYFLEPEPAKQPTVVTGNIEVRTGDVCPVSALWAPKVWEDNRHRDASLPAEE